MRTTLNISDALLSELKQKACKENRTFRETLEETIHRGLASPSRTQSVTIQPAPVGVKLPYQHLSMNQLYVQLESGEMDRVAES